VRGLSLKDWRGWGWVGSRRFLLRVERRWMIGSWSWSWTWGGSVKFK
jgi:hypothetical protein